MPSRAIPRILTDTVFGPGREGRRLTGLGSRLPTGVSERKRRRVSSVDCRGNSKRVSRRSKKGHAGGPSSASSDRHDSLVGAVTICSGDCRAGQSRLSSKRPGHADRHQVRRWRCSKPVGHQTGTCASLRKAQPFPSRRLLCSAGPHGSTRAQRAASFIATTRLGRSRQARPWTWPGRFLQREMVAVARQSGRLRRLMPPLDAKAQETVLAIVARLKDYLARCCRFFMPCRRPSDTSRPRRCRPSPRG